MPDSTDLVARPVGRRAAAPPRRTRHGALDWLGVVPFFLFALLFLLLPTGCLLVGAFQDAQGHFTLANLSHLLEGNVLAAYRISLEVSAVSAAVGVDVPVPMPKYCTA